MEVNGREITRVTVNKKLYDKLLSRSVVLDEILLLIGKSGKSGCAKLESVERLISEKNVQLLSERD